MKIRCNSSNNPILKVLLLGAILAFPVNLAWAQTAADAADEETADLDKVTVTGSRIKRAELEGPQPVLVIDREQMNDRGYTTVFEALADLTINNGYKFEGAETQLFTPDVQTLNLRGFGVGTTLTLINGRRLTNYPAAYQTTDTVFSFGSIPVAAIERIEILATGASAIYGSDAVAGVVNIILRKDVDETTVNALWGTPTETKNTRDDIRLQLVTGKTFTRGSYTFTAEYLNRDGIRGADYDKYDDQAEDYPYGDAVYIRNLMHFDNFRDFFGFPDRYVDPEELTGRTGDAACAQALGAPNLVNRPGAGNFCTNKLTSGVPATNFQNQRESYSLYFNGQYEIGNAGTELFTDILYYSADARSYNPYITLVEDILDLNEPDTIGFGFYDWWTMYRRFGAEDIGMSLDQTYEDTAWTTMVGARGVLGDVHDWEFSVNYSSYEFSSAQPALKWRETIDNFLGTWLGKSFFGNDWWSGGTLGEAVPFGLGIDANHFGTLPQSAMNAFGMQTYGNKTEDLFLQYVMNGDLMEMRSGPLQYAFVAEYEDEKLKFVPDDLIQLPPPTTDVNGDPVIGLDGSGWYRQTGYQGEGDRQRWSIGGELRIPLHETVTLNLAARYDDYDSTSTSFGGDLTPSASIEWRPTAGLLLRAGYTESFRAPDMAQVFVRTGFYTGGFDLVSCYEQYVFANGSDEGFDTTECDPSSLFARRVGAQDLGGDPLDAETGDSMWVGFSWDITDSLSVTVDYTTMALEQRVRMQSVQGLLSDEYRCFSGDQPNTTPCEQIPNQIIRQTDPTTGLSFIEQFYVTPINQYEEKGSFVDVKVVYDLNTEYGLFRFQGDYNNMLDHTYRLTSESDEVDLKNDPYAGGWDFRSSFIGSLTWAYRDFATTITGVYRGASVKWLCFGIGGCETGFETGENYIETENWWTDYYLTWNLTAQYNWTDEFMTRLRVVNLFDEDPPYDDTFSQFEEPWYNPYVYPGAGIGRYAALELEYTF